MSDELYSGPAPPIEPRELTNEDLAVVMAAAAMSECTVLAKPFIEEAAKRLKRVLPAPVDADFMAVLRGIARAGGRNA